MIPGGKLRKGDDKRRWYSDFSEFRYFCVQAQRINKFSYFIIIKEKEANHSKMGAKKNRFGCIELDGSANNTKK